MANNGNGFKKLSDALKKAAEEKGEALQKDRAPIITPPPSLPEKEKQQAPQEAPVYEAAKRPESQIRSTGISKKIVAYHNPTGPVAEQFRVLRMHACSSEKNFNIKVIVVTSSANGEGKSVAATNLAVVMAQDFGKPVLLIDCNIRKPAVDSLLGVRSDRGLADVLSGNLKLEEALVKTDIANLVVLPAGQAPANPNELLASDRMKALLAEVRPQFEAVVLDTPAVIPFADPRILSKVVDGVIIVVRAGKTRREVVARAESILKSVGANIMGYVLTGVEYHIPEYIHRHL
ncbi:MAG: CpsD/CapB family tyrosine-protein kinase [Candidatus Omnitrophota bacterium]|jgi:capsular exopolysaccharide synthesis family protein